MPKLVVMLRVKDGMFFAEEWLRCFEKIADEIVVLDNGSTDGTYEYLSAHPKVVEVIRTEGYNEGRDKNLLYAHVRQRKPDWCLWIDIDEIFEPGLTRKHFDQLMNSRLVNRFAFRRFHFIDRAYFAASWYRLKYISGHDRIMWREAPTGYFEDFVLDSPNIKGIKGLKGYTNFRLKHLGYINKDLVNKKMEIYQELVPEENHGGLVKQMFLSNERRMKWIDNRNDIRVILLNGLLNCILLTQMARKAVTRIVKLVFNSTRKPSASTASTAN